MGLTFGSWCSGIEAASEAWLPLGWSCAYVAEIEPFPCAILQGFPPNATLIDWPSANRKGEDVAETVAYLLAHGFSQEDAERLAQTPDGPRYKAIGNSWPVTVPRWIGERIQIVWQARAA